MKGTAMWRVLSLRKDEVEFLGVSARCDACGHLMALHNECCAFCQVPGCRCQTGYWHEAPYLTEELPGGGFVDSPVLYAPLLGLFAEVVD